MHSGTAAGADKPITNLVFETPRVIGSASATLMMSRAATLAHQQDGYTYAAATRSTVMAVRSGYLTEESIHEVLGIRGSTASWNNLPVNRFLNLGCLHKAQCHFISEPDSGGHPLQNLASIRIDRTNTHALNVEPEVLRCRRVIPPSVKRCSQSVGILDATCRLEFAVESDFERQHKDA
jgi:hypothetical protein